MGTGVAKHVVAHFPSICLATDQLEANTFCHGDFHPGNMFFQESSEEFKLIDWQMWGCSSNAAELAYALAMALPVNRPLDHDEFHALLRVYHDKLTSQPEVTGISKNTYPFSLLVSEVEATFTNMFFVVLFISCVMHKPAQLKLYKEMAELGDPNAKKKLAQSKLFTGWAAKYGRATEYVIDRNPDLSWRFPEKVRRLERLEKGASDRVVLLDEATSASR